MTYEEAHAYLENQQREFTTHRGAYADDLIEANGTAILALEKQIPKKPIKIYSHYLCPNCRSIKTGNMPFEHNCRMCGQALDWRFDDDLYCHIDRVRLPHGQEIILPKTISIEKKKLENVDYETIAILLAQCMGWEITSKEDSKNESTD